MESQRSAGGSSAATAATPRQQRARLRHKIHSLAYVNLDHSNGGIIRDLSEDGLAIRAVRPLQPEQPVHVRFELLNPRTRIEAAGQVVWATSTGEAGMRFLNLPARLQRQLKEWLFVQILEHARQDPVASAPGPPQLGIFAPSAAVESASLEGTTEVEASNLESQPEAIALPWWPSPISPVALALIVDAVLILSAVLLFCVITVAFAHMFPSWSSALALCLGLGAVFGFLFRSLFVQLNCDTPGGRLVQMAAENGNHPGREEDDQPRFR